MSRRGLAAAAALLLAAAAPRAGAEGIGEVSVHAGRMSLNLGKAAAGGGSATVTGASYGMQFLHSVGPFAELGLGLDFLKPADSSTEKLVANGRAETSIDSASFLGLLKVGSTEGNLQPHALLGLGVHVTSMKLSAQPHPGFGWIDTGTGEKRTLIDSEGMGPAVKLEGGADYAFNDGALAGAYLALNYLGSARYEATDQAKSLGLGSASGSMLAISIGVAFTARF